METTIDPFWYKLFVMIVLIAAQGFLWGWIGMEAREKLPWWPFKD
jgi:hypothetical protein